MGSIGDKNMTGLLRRPAAQDRSERRKILVIEDNDLHRRLLNDLLDVMGYVVLLAETGGSGIDVAQQEKPDLILLDRGLPDISGLDVARTLKSTPSTRSIPIVAVTAYAMPGDERALIQSGCNAYLSKPVRVCDLMGLIATFLPRP